MDTNSVSAKSKSPDKTVFYATAVANNRRKLWLAWLGWGVAFLLVLVLFATSLPHALFDVQFEWQVLQARAAAAVIFPTYDAFKIYILVLRMMAVAVFWGTAVYIVARKPKDWFVLYVSATLLMMSYLFAFQSDIDRWRFPNELLTIFPAIEWVAPFLFTICFLLLFYLFPDGRFTPRWIGLLGFSLAGFLLIFFAGLEEIVGLTGDWPWFLLIFCVLSIALIGLISQGIKWRQATLVQKQQTRLVILALSAFVLLPFIAATLSDFFPDTAWWHFLSLHLFLLGATLIPLAIGVSVLRFRLWDMHKLLNRTLVYGSVTIIILTAYVLLVGGISTLFQTNANFLTAAVATGVIALLAHPLRLYLQRLVNRLMYGQRNDPIAVIAALGIQLENTAVPDETLAAVVHTITQTLKLPYAAIVTNENEVVVYAGETAVATRQTYALIYQSQTIGQLVVAPRSAQEQFAPDEERLLQNLARQAGTAVYVAQLTEKLRRSRKRLVTATEEERLRLRRDLHDGLGPQMAALTIKASAAQNLLKSDPGRTQILLQELKTDAQTAVHEIRRVVEGLRPSTLDQLGLYSALQALQMQNSSSETEITLTAPNPLPQLPAAVEVAAYRIATEAINNCLRHAQATKCELQLTLPNDLVLTVMDDGQGLTADSRPGIGLTSMRERAEELGGTFAIISNEQGTTVTVVLPI